MSEYAKAIITVALAIGGWVFTFWMAEKNRSRENERERQRRSEDHEKDLAEHRRDMELARLNDQIEMLYGPLHANLIAGEAVWDSFWRMYRPSHGQSAYFHPDFPNTEEELRIWRTWVTSVFQPVNRDMATRIIENAHLIELDSQVSLNHWDDLEKTVTYPEPFLNLIAHVKAYDGVIKSWEEGDYSRHTAERNFPKNIREMVSQTYATLIKRRETILRDKVI